MARIRSIKPQMWASADFASLSRDARLLFIGLMSNADDDGRLVATPAALLGAVYPLDTNVTPRQLATWMDEIERRGMVCVYETGGFRYAQLTGWGHQKISHHYASVLPPPPESFRNGSGMAPESSRNDSALIGSGLEIDMEGAGNGKPPREPRPPKPPAEPKPPDEAQRILKAFWDQSDPKPASNYLGALAACRRILKAGYSPDELTRALPQVGTISGGWLETQIKKQRAEAPPETIWSAHTNAKRTPW